MNSTLIMLEIWGFLQVPIMWYIFKRYAKRNVIGEIVASGIVGVFWEVSTEPLWDYHFLINFHKDIPITAITGWMVMLTLVIFLSEKIYCFLFKKTSIEPRDKRIFMIDIFSAFIICLPFETVGYKLGVWTYRQDLLHWDWGHLIPFFNMPYEILSGYALVMLVAPTFVRYWEKSFEGNA
jgi:hypothetical protein